jgi:type II secretory pathway pseudopilin PulG
MLEPRRDGERTQLVGTIIVKTGTEPNAHVTPAIAPPRSRHALASGFTLVDVLVTMTVIAVLIGLLVPSLAGVNETARRVACQSNVRQIGLGIVMYANDFGGHLPSSRYVRTSSQSMPAGYEESPDKMVLLRVPPSDIDPTSKYGEWDGLGLLYNTGYMNAAKIFYCPSHKGETTFTAYARTWASGEGEIACNYLFRGHGPTSRRIAGTNAFASTDLLWNIDPAQSSLIADSMCNQSDYNHRVGVNFFRADLSVHWYNDPAGRLLESLPEDKSSPDPQAVVNAWNALDASANAEPR